MAPAVAKREESEPDHFVGQVLHRGSPILTWRPALEARAERERLAAANPEEISAASFFEDHESVVRMSRAPTRKMIAWPVMPRLRRETDRRQRRRRTVRAVLASVTVLLTLTSVVLGVRAWDACGFARPEPPPARVLAAHVLDEGFDTLARPAPLASARVTPALTPPLTKATVPSSVHRGRAHHGHRPPTASNKR